MRHGSNPMRPRRYRIVPRGTICGESARRCPGDPPRPGSLRKIFYREDLGSDLQARKDAPFLGQPVFSVRWSASARGGDYVGSTRCVPTRATSRVSPVFRVSLFHVEQFAGWPEYHGDGDQEHVAGPFLCIQFSRSGDLICRGWRLRMPVPARRGNCPKY